MLKREIKVSNLTWTRKNKINGIKVTGEKNKTKQFRSHQCVCKCLGINTTQARAVNKDEHCSQLLYHLSIWSTTVNAKFSSCKIDVNECLLQRRLKSEYLLNGILLRQSDTKRDFRVIVQKSQKPTAFSAAAVGITNRIPASLWKKCSQCFRKILFCYLRDWQSRIYYLLSTSSQYSTHTVSLPELRAN